MKQAEEAKLKSEAEKAAAAKAAFEATFKALPTVKAANSDSEDEEDEKDLANKPIGPVDPLKCTAAGAGIAGGTACAPATFMVVTKDADGRKVPHGGAQIKVNIAPGVGVGGTEQEGIVKDIGDGTYTVTYVVPKRGNYMVNIECNGKLIMGSPFPVFFSQGTASGGLLGMPPTSTYPNLVNQTMPNMPNYSASASGAFPGILGMIPGVIAGASGGVILPGIGASLGEVCRDYLNNQCAKTDCKLTHPPHNLLMTAISATTTMGTLSQVPMAPSAAAMAAARAIVAAQALQAHAAQVQAQSTKDSSGSSEKSAEDDAAKLKKTLQVSNLSPLLTVEQLKQLFSFCGTVVECTITESKHFAYIEYEKPEEATAALALNNMDVGGRPLNVEMAKSLPQKPVMNSLASSSLPMMMQQAVAMQQMQFQQALLMQQTMTAQQAANRAASMKSATELAAARAAEISKKLKADGLVDEDKEPKRTSRSPTPRARSKSKSRSPVRYQWRRSPSYSPPFRHRRNRRSRSPYRFRNHVRYSDERRSYRSIRDDSDRGRRRDSDRSHDRRSSISRRGRSRSISPRRRKTYKSRSKSPRGREVSPPEARKSSRGGSRSPKNHGRIKSSPCYSDDKLKHKKSSKSETADARDDRSHKSRDGKSKRHKRDRSLSVEEEHRDSRLSPSSDKKVSKHSRLSRSRSVEDRSSSKEKGNESRERKSKHRDRKRSRSISPEEKHYRSKGSSPRDGYEGKSKHRRRSRSISAERIERKSKRRSSRSLSLEGKHLRNSRTDKARDEKSRERSRKRSISPEDKNFRSPRSSKKSNSENRRHSDEKNIASDKVKTLTRDSSPKDRSFSKSQYANQERNSKLEESAVVKTNNIMDFGDSDCDLKKTTEFMEMHEDLGSRWIPTETLKSNNSGLENGE